jgi:hypothetical protein
MSKPIKLTVEITEEQVWAFARFFKAGRIFRLSCPCQP